MEFIIYANNKGWKEISRKPTLEEAVSVLDDLVEQEITHFIVVQSSLENGDIPVIATMHSYLEAKEQLKEKQKTKGLRKWEQ